MYAHSTTRTYTHAHNGHARTLLTHVTDTHAQQAHLYAHTRDRGHTHTHVPQAFFLNHVRWAGGFVCLATFKGTPPEDKQALHLSLVSFVVVVFAYIHTYTHTFMRTYIRIHSYYTTHTTAIHTMPNMAHAYMHTAYMHTCILLLFFPFRYSFSPRVCPPSCPASRRGLATER